MQGKRLIILPNSNGSAILPYVASRRIQVAVSKNLTSYISLSNNGILQYLL